MSFLPKTAIAASEETSVDTDLQTEMSVEKQSQELVSSTFSPLPDLSASNNQPLFSESTLSVQTQPSPTYVLSPTTEMSAITDSSSSEFSQLRDRLFGESPQALPVEVVLNRQKISNTTLLSQAELDQTSVDQRSVVAESEIQPSTDIELAQATTTPEPGVDEDSPLPTLTPTPASSTPPTDSLLEDQPAPPGAASEELDPDILDSNILGPDVLGPDVSDPGISAPPNTSELEINTLPDSLFADPNPLTFPTTTEEVTIEQNPLVTLEQAVELAYRNNQSLQSALLSQEQATAAVREARAALFPNVDIAANATTQESTRPTNVAGLGEVGEPSGADTTISGSAEVNYNILTGGSRRASIRAAELQEQISTLAVEVQQEQIRLNTANAYYDLQNAGEQIRINQSFLEEAARNLRDSRLRQEVGVGTRFDTLRAEVQFANARQSVIQSQSQERTNRRAIAQLLNLPSNASIRATPVAVAEIWPLSLEESILLAFQNRAELEQQLYQADLNEEQRKIALAAIRPRVQLFANYSAQTFVNDNDGILDNYSFGARFNWTPFDGGAARARARQQEIASQIAEEQFSLNLDQVRFDVEQSFFSLQANQENIATSEVAVAQAEEALALANLRLQAGVGTQLDVLTAQSELTQAEANNVAAILGYNRALVSIERAISNVSTLF